MKRSFLTKTFFAGFLLVALFFAVSTVNASYLKIYTVSGFINMLVEKGIIPENKIEKAKEISQMAEALESVESSNTALNSDKVSVSVNQLIEHADLKYNAYTDITGLLLLVKNTSDEDIFLEAKRGCQVVYTIINSAGNVVYTNKDTKVCKTNEKVRYLLRAGKTRMFQINHKRDDKRLGRGVYTVKMEYPGYGGGEKIITVE